VGHVAAVVVIAIALASNASAKTLRDTPSPFAAEAALIERRLPKMKPVKTDLEHMGGEGAEGTAWLDARGRVRKMILTRYGERGRAIETHYLDEAEQPTLVLTRHERYREQIGGDTSVVSTYWCRYHYAGGAALEGTCIDERGHRESQPAEGHVASAPDLLTQFHETVIADQIERIAKRRGAELSVEIKVISLDPTFPIRDMPQGYGRWHLTAEVLGCQIGGCMDVPVGSRFTVDVDLFLFQGPVHTRPLGLWVNEQPKVGSIWVAFFRTWTKDIPRLFAGKAEQALLVIAREELSR
jgi:hypothetical protein